MRGRGLWGGVVLAGVLLATGAGSAGGSLSAQVASPTTTVVRYDTFSSDAAGGYSLADYQAKWSNPYGMLDMGVAPGDTRRFRSAITAPAHASGRGLHQRPRHPVQ